MNKKLIKQKFRDITFKFFWLKNIWHRYLTLVAYIVVYVSRLFSLFGGVFWGGGGGAVGGEGEGERERVLDA